MIGFDILHVRSRVCLCVVRFSRAPRLLASCCILLQQARICPDIRGTSVAPRSLAVSGIAQVQVLDLGVTSVYSTAPEAQMRLR